MCSDCWERLSDVDYPPEDLFQWLIVSARVPTYPALLDQYPEGPLIRGHARRLFGCVEIDEKVVEYINGILKDRVGSGAVFEALTVAEVARLLAGDPPCSGAEAPEAPARVTGRKRSTAPGEARDKLIAALTKHHRYNDGSCLNQEPVANNELARQVGVAAGSASAFFKKTFGGWSKYRAACRDAATLAFYLKVLRGEFTPDKTFGRKPPGEDRRDDDD
jgi:hypothetical protein